MDDLRTGLFEDVAQSNREVSTYRRYLQDHFVNLLINGLDALTIGDKAGQ
jgi:hypothetical protein